MKNNNIITQVIYISFVLFSFYSCKKSFLDLQPQGVYSENQLLNKEGVEGMLINAYASLDGNFRARLGDIGMSLGASNWVYGSIAGGEAYKGGVNFNDQTELNAIMQWGTPASNPEIDGKWTAIYDGIGRANQVLIYLGKVTDPALTAADRLQLEAEARFIRAFQHFQGKEVFGNIPFVDETATDFKIPNVDESGNYVNIWPRIEEDFKFAYDNLDAVKPEAGRVNKWAAGAYLAKAYLFQKKFDEAKSLFDVIIAQGTTSKGISYDLLHNFEDNFRIATQNGAEDVFAVQMAIDESGTNGYADALLTYPDGIAGGTNSWFFRPSQDIVNSFRTDASGLPLVNNYNDLDVTSFEGVSDQDPFTAYEGNLDPRLDHSVGRRGIPYLDWGMMTGVAFTAPPGESIQNGGPYCGKKQVFSKAEFNSGLAPKVGWFFANAKNYTAMRFADVLLMAAECEVEVGSMDKAREYVNRVRSRAKNSPVKNLSGNADAANYVVGLYETSWTSKEEARTAVRFERKIELALEGHRFFDLVRWGIADQFINTVYLPKASIDRPLLFPSGVHFDKDRDEYQPIPIYAITQSGKDGQPTLKQNPGY